MTLLFLLAGCGSSVSETKGEDATDQLEASNENFPEEAAIDEFLVVAEDLRFGDHFIAPGPYSDGAATIFLLEDEAGSQPASPDFWSRYRLDTGDRVPVVNSSSLRPMALWTIDANLDRIPDLVSVDVEGFKTKISVFYGPLTAAVELVSADWTLEIPWQAYMGYVIEVPSYGPDESGAGLFCVVSPKREATDSCIGWPLPLEPGRYELSDVLTEGGFLLPRELWRHKQLTTRSDFPPYEYYFSPIRPKRCRISENDAHELISGTFNKLGIVWDFDEVVAPGKDDIGPSQQVVIATSTYKVQGFTPSDLECLDLDGDGFDEVMVSTRSSIDASDGQPDHVFMLDAPFDDLESAWANRITITEGPEAGRTMTNLGDLDGDGLSDLCLSVSDSYFGHFEKRPSEIRLILSSQGPKPATVITGEDGDGLACEEGAGDVDGDGLVDFLIRSPEREALWLITGERLRSLAE